LASVAPQPPPSGGAVAALAVLAAKKRLWRKVQSEGGFLRVRRDRITDRKELTMRTLRIPSWVGHPSSLSAKNMPICGQLAVCGGGSADRRKPEASFHITEYLGFRFARGGVGPAETGLAGAWESGAAKKHHGPYGSVY